MALGSIAEILADLGLTSAFISQFLRKPVPPGTPPAAAPAAKIEDPLKQQVASVNPLARDDKAILIAVDTALAQLSGGADHLASVIQVRVALKGHQRTDWRKNLTSLTLTERFKEVRVWRTITKFEQLGDPLQQPAAAQPRRRGNQQGGQQDPLPGTEKTEHKFERLPLDYEWTADDPRVKHLILVSELVKSQAVAGAIAYLISAGFIQEKSVDEITAEWAAAAGTKVAGGAYHAAAKLVLDRDTNEHLRSLPEGDAREQELSNALDQGLVAITQETEDLKKAPLPKWFKIAMGAGTTFLLILWLPWIFSLVGGAIALLGTAIWWFKFH